MSTTQITPPVSYEVFQSDLLPSETIEWTGQPNPGVIFHQEDFALIPFSLLWGGFAIFWLLGASGVLFPFSGRHANNGFGIFAWIWGTPFVVVGQYMIWGRFVYARWKKRRTYYALTNRRALIIQTGIRGRSASSAYLDTISIIDKRVRTDGNGSISFGGAVTGEVRWGKNLPPRPPTFDDIDDANTVYQIALRIQDRARSSAEPSSRWPK